MIENCLEVAYAWRMASYQIGIISLFIGYALGRWMPYIIAYVKAWKDGRITE